MQADNDVTRILNARTWCDVLGVNEAILKEPNYLKLLKKAYFKLSLRVHPDKNSDPRAKEAFQLLGTVYKLLTETGVNRPVRSQAPPPVKQSTPQSEETDDFASRIFEEMMRGKNKKQSEFTSAQEKLFSKLKPECQAKTKDGFKCSNSRRANSTYCHVHRDYDPNEKKAEKLVKVQCKAKTKEGVQCSKWAVENGLYCSLHRDYDPNVVKQEPSAKVRCYGTTKTGNPCMSYAQKDSKFCKSHK